MDLMLVFSSGAVHGQDFQLIVQGDDEQAALDALVQLVADGFGES